MTGLESILQSWEPMSLEETDSVKLMNRVDVKFVFPLTKLPHFLEEMKPGFRVLEVNGIRLSHYETLYFDTDDYRLYHTHHNGRLNRWKIRCRSYLDCNLSYFEIKFKNNKGRTIKERVKRKQENPVIEGRAETLLREHTGFQPSDLHPVLRVTFSRMTLVNREMSERITIDTELAFSDPSVPGSSSTAADGQFPAAPAAGRAEYKGLAIAEVKMDSAGHSHFNDIMRRHRIREFSISKYCLGMIRLKDHIRKNNFKPKLLIIQKLNRYAG